MVSRILDTLYRWLMVLLRPWAPPPRDVPDEGVEAIRVAVGLLLRDSQMIIHKQDQFGVQMSEATDLLVQLNDATNAVATRIDELVSELENESDASPEVLQGLRDLSTRLQGLATDPDQPVPPVEEPPVDNGGDNIPPIG